MFNSIRMLMNSSSVLGYFLQVVPITAVVALVYCLCRLCQLKKRGEKPSLGTELLHLIFVCYVTGLFNLIVMPANFWLSMMDGIAFGWWEEILPVFSIGEVNLIPSILLYLRGELTIGSWVKHMLLGNIAMFLPMGFLLPFVTKKVSVKIIWKIAILVPLAMELLQLVFGRSLDVDDLICNFAGILIGFFFALPIKKRH